jgi:alkylhydroperoxidase family enzyme
LYVYKYLNPVLPPHCIEARRIGLDMYHSFFHCLGTIPRPSQTFNEYENPTEIALDETLAQVLTTMEPRIKPLPESEWTEEVRDLMGMPQHGIDTRNASQFLSTLVRHPGLYRRYAAFAGKLLMTGKLPPRDRELAILRGAWLCQAPLEWGEHVDLAHTVGLTAHEVELVIAGPDHPGWAAHERAILRSVDELHSTAQISDGTWAALAVRFDEKQLIELLMLIGAYQMIAYVQNALRVPLRQTNEGLAAR